MTEIELFQALRPIYPPEQFALLPQVSNGTGANRNRRHADGIALGLWPSRGIDLHGFEIKCYRGDWLRELKAPAKAEEIAQYCNYWWIVAPTAEMVPAEELPRGWGLYAWDGQKLKRQIAANHRKSVPIDLKFMAAILRQAQSCVGPESAVNEARREGFESGMAQAKLGRDDQMRRYESIQKRVDAFTKASGLDIMQSSWANDIEMGVALGAAVKTVLEGSVESGKANLIRMAKKILTELEAA